jgi:hypothetical protein
MPIPNTLDICRKDLFANEDKLREQYPEVVVVRVLRIRDMYLWTVANPEAKDRQFVEELLNRYDMSRVMAYKDLGIVKSLLPSISAASRDFHRWRFNEMILETYQMAKKRKDTKTMEKAASSYAKNNNVGLEEEAKIPYELLLVQPFVPTMDPSVLGITPIPNLQEKIDAMLEKYKRETIDIEDVTFEEADLEEDIYFPPLKENTEDGEEAGLL